MHQVSNSMSFKAVESQNVDVSLKREINLVVRVVHFKMIITFQVLLSLPIFFIV